MKSARQNRPRLATREQLPLSPGHVKQMLHRRAQWVRSEISGLIRLSQCFNSATVNSRFAQTSCGTPTSHDLSRWARPPQNHPMPHRQPHTVPPSYPRVMRRTQDFQRSDRTHRKIFCQAPSNSCQRRHPTKKPKARSAATHEQILSRRLFSFSAPIPFSNPLPCPELIRSSLYKFSSLLSPENRCTLKPFLGAASPSPSPAPPGRPVSACPYVR
jgi:hypothetical protein